MHLPKLIKLYTKKAVCKLYLNKPDIKKKAINSKNVH